MARSMSVHVCIENLTSLNINYQEQIGGTINTAVFVICTNLKKLSSFGGGNVLGTLEASWSTISCLYSHSLRCYIAQILLYI